MIAIREENPEVLYAEDPFVVIGPDDIAELKRRALETPRGRCRICFHDSPGADLHEMLIVHQRDAWVPPHKHVGKQESLHVIEGSATLVGFCDDGRVDRTERLGEDGILMYRMPSDTYHTLLIDSEWFVFHETILGPFERSRTVFPDWAPIDDGAEARDFTHRLQQQL